MVVEAIVIALLVAWTMGGRPTRLADMPLKGSWLIACPVALYACSWVLRGYADLSATCWLFGALHLLSILSLILLCAWNRKIPGALLIALGLGLNAVAIASNGGFMPASREAVGLVFGQDYLAKALDAPHVRSSFIDSATHLWWLCDIIPKTFGPYIFRTVSSVGDMVMTLGICVTIIKKSRVPIATKRSAEA